jgi:pilus assembly protein CpaE
MERPTVLLALAADTADYTTALDRAGFTVVHEFAGEQLASGSTFDLAVLDCDADPALIKEIHAFLQGEKTTPTLLLLGDDSPDFTDASWASDELALKPLAADALVYRLQALLIRSGRQLSGESSNATSDDDGTQAIGEGRAISIFAPKGGVGKTTIAVNVAVGLREQTRERVLLLDADVGVGNVTSVLQVPSTMGLVDLADSDPSEWTDAAFEHATATHAGSGLRVLTWGNQPGDSERVTVDLLLAALKWARSHHAYVIVDNHPGYDDRTMAMLTVSNEIFLVVTPEVGPIRNSSQFLDLARQVGLGDVVRVIANRANHGVGMSDMAQSLGLPISATIVSNGPKAVVAANEGTPIITKFPKERISTDLHNVVRLVTRQAEVPTRAATRRWRLPFASRASNA